MKKIVLIGVVALTATGALARGRVADDPKKVLERYRDSVLSEIRTEAYRQATAEMEEKFGIVYVGWSDRAGETKWTNNCGKSLLLWAGRSGTYYKYDKNGRLAMTGERNDFEEWRWRDAQQKEIQEALWQDQSVIGAVVSNIFAREEARAREFQDSTQNCQSRMGSLEELIPLEEALSLAKDGKGKGYFQLALRYASEQELPSEPRTAYKMLRKAVDANYANAILVEGILDEANLTMLSEKPRWKDDGSSLRKALREYCGNGVRFNVGRSGQTADALTNEVSFARVMRKYEKAKELGALTATNQIDALNKRLADFNKAFKRWVNDRDVHSVIRAKEAGEMPIKVPINDLRMKLQEEARTKSSVSTEKEAVK